MKNDFLNTALSSHERARHLLSLLTLKEKVGQLNQKLYGFSSYTIEKGEVLLAESFLNEVERWNGLGVLYGLYRADPWAGKDYESGLTDSLSIEAYNLVQKHVIENSRYGIPVLMSSECPHGHQALDGYLLPVNLALGATWNIALTKSAYEVCAKQMKNMGVDLALISMLDVLRDPRWGRSEECYSEDPYLSAQMASAVVSACVNQGVDVVAKHFCAQGETTGGVNASAARIGERELREIHFPAMISARKAGAKGVMAAYNEIDGVPCHANEWLLRDVLREEMGFDGIVMADGTAIDRLDVLTKDPIKSGAMAIKSGIDVSLWDDGFTHLEEAVENGYVDESVIDEAVLRILELKFSRGLFENPYLQENSHQHFTIAEYPETLELSRQSPVLLKNNGILPLDKSKIKSIAVVGSYASDIYALAGDYTPPIRKNNGYNILEGLKAFSPPETTIEYLGDYSNAEKIKTLVKNADVTVMVLGGSSSRFAGADFDDNGAALSISAGTDCGEGVDVASLNISENQLKLADCVYSCGKNIVTVINAGRPYVAEPLAIKSGALLYSFYPGPYGGQVIAEILWGIKEPAGRLPASLPAHAGQIPAYYNYKNSYDGMKYSDVKGTPLYHFGYGMGYGKPVFSDVKINYNSLSIADLKTKSFTLSGTVTNPENRPLWVVPMLFVKILQSSTVRRVRELKAFEKIYLNAKESQAFDLSVGLEALSVWDSKMHFTPEAGEIELILFEGTQDLAQIKVTITE